MKKVLRKSNLAAGILILVVVCLGIVFAGDVIVKEGIGIFDKIGIGTTSPSEALDLASGNFTTTGAIEGGVFKSTGCTATGTKAVALGALTEASGAYSTAMGYDTTASGAYSTAMGKDTIAGGMYSTAMGLDAKAEGEGSAALGYYTTASGEYSLAAGFISYASGDYSIAMGKGVGASPADYTTAIGKEFTNSVANSFAVGYGQKDFSVKSGDVHVYGKLTVEGDFDPKTLELQLQERNSVIERYEKYVTPDKKSGVVYINTETKQIEVYYPYEGVIRNIQGQIIYSLPSIRINNDYETYYVFDTLTGQVVEKQRAVYDKYRIKEGIEFDSSTGQFINKTTEQIITKEEAIELYR